MNVLLIRHLLYQFLEMLKNTNNIRTSYPKVRTQFDESTILSVCRLVALKFLANYSKRRVKIFR